MGQNQLIRLIHSAPTVDREWKRLTPEQKRQVLDELRPDADELDVMAAIRVVVTRQPELFS